MPNNVDERVVEMRIDNRQFVNGAEKTITILDRLKSALNFKDSEKSLNNLNNAANKVDFSGMATSIDDISNRFSVMGIIGMRVISNLTDSVYRYVTTTAKALSIDQIMAGFGKYESVLSSTQTIMAATRQEQDWENTRMHLDYVNEQLDDLNWFTDETSFNLSDMVNNIGKFTNAGVPLAKAVQDMEGIAVWSGLSGATMNEASRAMYNLSQAMALGSVRLMDWRSIENANMATLEFKQTVIDTAVEIGTLREVSEGVYETLNGKDVSAKNFTENLSEQWFNTEVLEGALEKYGAFTTELKAVQDELGRGYITTTDFLDALDAYEKDETSLVEWHQKLADVMGSEVPTIDELREAMETLSSEELELGKRAFKASQEYKTFKDAIEATKDAVSTGWMKTFQYIFGDYEEAKKVWSALGDELNDIFAAGAKRRNDILKVWHDTGGRDAFLESIANLYSGFMSFIDPIREAFSDIFSLGSIKEAAQKLLELTERFLDFSKTVGLSEEAMKGLYNIFSFFFSGIKRTLSGLEPVFTILGKLISYASRLLDAFLSAFAYGGFNFSIFKSRISDLFVDIQIDILAAWEAIKSFFASLEDVPVIGPALGLIATVIDKIKEGVASLKESLSEVEISGPLEAIGGILIWIRDLISGIEFNTEGLKNALKNVGGFFGTLWTGLVGSSEEFRAKVKELVSKGIQGALDALKEINLSEIFEGARLGVLTYVAIQFANFVSSFKKAADAVSSIPDGVTKILSNVASGIKGISTALKKSIQANQMIKIAVAIAILAGSMWLLSKVPSDKFMEIAVTLSFLIIVISKVLKSLSNLSINSGNTGNKLVVNILPKMAATLIAIAIVLAVIVGVMERISKLSWPQISQGLTVIGLVLIMLYMAMKGMSKLDIDINWQALGKLVVIATVIRAAGIAIARIGKLPWQNILAAGAMIAAILGAVVAILAVGKNIKSATPIILSLVAITIALTLLVPAFMVLSLLGPEKTLNAFIALFAIVTIVAAMFVIFKHVGSGEGAKGFALNLIGIGAALLLFSAALALAAPAIISLTLAFIATMEKLMTLEDFGKALGRFVALAGVIAVLGAAFIVVGVAAVLMGAGMLLAGAGMLLFGAGVALVANNIVLLTAVLLPFGTVLTAFVDMVSENGDKILSLITTVILGIVAILVLHKVKIAFAALSVIIAIVNVIVQHGDEILSALSVIFSKVLVFLSGLIPKLVAFLVGGIIIIINDVANTLRANLGALIDALENLVSVILEAFIQLIFRAFGDLAALIAKGISVLFGAEDLSDTFRDAGIELGQYFSGGVKDAITDESATTGQAGRDIIDSITAEDPDTAIISEWFAPVEDAVETPLEGMVDNARAAGGEIISGLGEGVGENEDSVETSLGSIAENVASNFDLGDTASGFGTNFIESFGKSAQARSDWLNTLMGSLGSGAAGAFGDSLGIHSPSKVARAFGNFWDEGFVLGIYDSEGSIIAANESVAFKMADGMKTALSSAYAIAQDGYNMAPRITPVIDMSGASRDGARLSGIVSGAGLMDSSIDITRSQAIDVSASFNNAQRDEGIKTITALMGQMIKAMENPQDLYLNDRVLAGRINRRLGKL